MHTVERLDNPEASRLYWWYLHCSRFLTLCLFITVVSGPPVLFWSILACSACLQLGAVMYSLFLRVPDIVVIEPLSGDESGRTA